MSERRKIAVEMFIHLNVAFDAACIHKNHEKKVHDNFGVYIAVRFFALFVDSTYS
jgi:hypothetical protein